MGKTPVVVLISSLIFLLLSFGIIGAGFNDIREIDVESESIFQGSSGSVSVESATYTVFVNDQYTCSETIVSISDETYEYFNELCDPDFDEKGWKAIGVMESDVSTQLTVDSNHEILIVDDLMYLSEGGLAIFGGLGLCCFGLIGVITGIILLSTQKKPVQVLVQQPMAQGYQQPMQQEYQQPAHQEYSPPISKGQQDSPWDP